MLLRALALASLTLTVASAEWKKPAHNLAYFKTHPCLRADLRDRPGLLECTELTEADLHATVRTELRVLGKFGGLTVYDLNYFLRSEERFAMRSVLVETAPDQLHEIATFVNLPPMAEHPLTTIFPSELIEVDAQAYVKLKDDLGGMYHPVDEQYFVLRKDGVLPLEIEPVYAAAEKVVPKGMMTFAATAEFTLESHVFRIRTERTDTGGGPKVSCCEGHVEVTFTIEKDRVIVRQAKFFPE